MEDGADNKPIPASEYMGDILNTPVADESDTTNVTVDVDRGTTRVPIPPTEEGKIRREQFDQKWADRSDRAAGETPLKPSFDQRTDPAAVRIRERAAGNNPNQQAA